MIRYSFSITRPQNFQKIVSLIETNYVINMHTSNPLQTIGIPDIPEPDSFCTVIIRLTIYINPIISVLISNSLGILDIGLD